MSLTYSTYLTTIATLMEVSASDADFLAILPQIIDYAEGRIYRETDLINTRVADSSSTLSSNTRTFTFPVPATGRFAVVEQINIVESSSRTPLRPVSREFLDLAWPTATASASTVRPQYYAPFTDQVIVVGPPSGATVTLEVVGTIRPTALSASNTTTYLSTYLPELLVAASMIFAAGYKMNYGAQADDPKQAVSWEAQYQSLLASVNMEDARRKYAGASWTSKRAEPTAVNQRG